MKLIALLDDPVVIEKILRHLKLWPTTTLSPSWCTRKIRTSRRNRCAQNWCRIGLNCRQPAIVARPGHHHTPAGRNLDPGAGFLVWFSQKSGTSRGPADVLSGNSGKQILISRSLTPNVKCKVRNALNLASGKAYSLEELFTY